MSDLFPQVRDILLHQWDPIGIAKIPGAWDDEYDRYAHRICERVKRGEDVRKLADYLFKLETLSMGLGGSRWRCERVAAMLVALVSNR